MIVPKPSNWHDFSNADCVIAIRNFGASIAHVQRPALKLFNAWLARTPAILGFESAYRQIGRINSDYLEAQSESEVIQHLKLLASSVQVRQALIDKGEIRAQEITELAIRGQWISLLEDVVYPHFVKWKSNQVMRARALAVGQIREKLSWRFPARFHENQTATKTFPEIEGVRKPELDS